MAEKEADETQEATAESSVAQVTDEMSGCVLVVAWLQLAGQYPQKSEMTKQP